MKHDHEVVTVFVSYLGSVSCEIQCGGWCIDNTEKYAITISLHMLSCISLTVIYSLNTTYIMYKVEKRTVLHKPRFSQSKVIETGS
jgi:hypothetical protein